MVEGSLASPVGEGDLRLMELSAFVSSRICSGLQVAPVLRDTDSDSLKKELSPLEPIVLKPPSVDLRTWL